MENDAKCFFIGGFIISALLTALFLGLSVHFGHPAAVACLVLASLLLLYFSFFSVWWLLTRLTRKVKGAGCDHKPTTAASPAHRGSGSSVVLNINPPQSADLPAWRIEQLLAYLPYFDQYFIWTESAVRSIRTICGKSDLCHAHEIMKILIIATPDLNCIIQDGLPWGIPPLQLFHCRDNIRRQEEIKEVVGASPEKTDLEVCQPCRDIWRLLNHVGVNSNSDLFKSSMDDESGFSIACQSSALSLQNLTRVMIRRTLYPNVFYACNKLPLPDALQNYLVFDETVEKLSTQSVKSYFYFVGQRLSNTMRENVTVMAV